MDGNIGTGGRDIREAGIACSGYESVLDANKDFQPAASGWPQFGQVVSVVTTKPQLKQVRG